MSNHSTDSLVYCSAGLQLVPGIAIYLTFLISIFSVQVVLFSHNLGVKYLRIRYPSHNDASSCIVHKVNALTELPSTHCYEYRFAFLYN